MKRLASLALLFLTGCGGFAPFANFLDFAFPAKQIPPGTPTHGGVGIPQPAPPPGAVVPAPTPETPPLPGLPIPGQ